MTIQDIIASDITDVFGIEENTPLSVQAVYTPVGGAAQTAVTVFYSNSPLHGDSWEPGSVEQENIGIVGKPADVSGWKEGGTVTINSFDYEVAEYPYPTDSFWTIVPLRKPNTNQTKI